MYAFSSELSIKTSKKLKTTGYDTSMPAMLVLTLDSSKPFRRTYYVCMLITFPRFLISTLEFRRELGLYLDYANYSNSRTV